jgi:hypothetical protein
MVDFENKYGISYLLISRLTFMKLKSKMESGLVALPWFRGHLKNLSSAAGGQKK